MMMLGESLSDLVPKDGLEAIEVHWGPCDLPAQSQSGLVRRHPILDCGLLIWPTSCPATVPEAEASAP